MMIVGWMVGRVQAWVIVCGCGQVRAHLIGSDWDAGYVVVVVGCDSGMSCLGGMSHMGRVCRVYGRRLGSRDRLSRACSRVVMRVGMMRMRMAKRV